MSILEKVQSADNLDILIQIVKEDKEKGFRIQAQIIRFVERESGEAKVKKKASAYFESPDLDAAQNGAIERAAKLLGL